MIYSICEEVAFFILGAKKKRKEKKMEQAMDQKSLERIVSQKALQIGSSFPCKICVMGFLCGICLTSLFLAALTSFATFQPFSTTFSNGFSTIDSDSRQNVPEPSISGIDGRVSDLYTLWSKSIKRNKGSITPKAPHLEDCKLRVELNHRLDTRLENQSFPGWRIWKGKLDEFQPLPSLEQQLYTKHPSLSNGAYPPWITGSDDENYPLTRKVQRDIWLHQHPINCRDPSVKFLVADWERIPGFGMGAQFAGMCGLLAIAMNQNRVLVANYYNRADHDGCKGSSRSSWSCYFFPETSEECREYAFELLKRKEAWERGIITVKENYTSKEIWSGKTPRTWGKPWSYMQPTTDVNGSLIAYHRKMDRRWWRAQALRYLMRFQTEYTCKLLNIARHEAFGMEAAKMVVVLATPAQDFLLENAVEKGGGYDIEKYVWSNHKPWIPRPMLSMHVRMGDKACEMKVVGFEEYMHLATRIRKRFPNLNSIWLSTEMQEVIDRSKLFQRWRFYFTNVTRQVGNMTMATYEGRLGRETSTNYPLVNFLMASEADFFIGALGSTWCFLIDGMRSTGGKVMSGYLSVNKDRFW